jgi:hypothetical protein
VFDTNRLEALMAEEQSAYLYWYMGLSEVHYFTDSQSLPVSFFELADKSKESSTPCCGVRTSSRFSFSHPL